jgi:hypothetical protein
MYQKSKTQLNVVWILRFTQLHVYSMARFPRKNGTQIV